MEEGAGTLAVAPKHLLLAAGDLPAASVHCVLRIVLQAARSIAPCACDQGAFGPLLEAG